MLLFLHVLSLTIDALHNVQQKKKTKEKEEEEEKKKKKKKKCVRKVFMLLKPEAFDRNPRGSIHSAAYSHLR